MHVVVLGGGYAGISLTRRLERILPAEVTLTLVDDSGAHVIQHLLHRLIRYPDLTDHLRIPLRELVDRAELVEGAVSAIDVDRPEVTLEDGRTIQPDYVAVCVGAVTADHGLQGIAEYGQPLKRIEDARSIRETFRVLDSGDRVVVGGAGLSGVQVAGELAAAGGEHEIVLLEQASSVAPGFPEAFQQTVSTALEEAGVQVRTSQEVRGATEDVVNLDSPTSCPYDQFIWTGGITGGSALRGDRPDVRADLRLADSVFGLGDAVTVTDDRGEIARPSAQTAVRQAKTASVNLGRLVEAKSEGNLVFEPRLQRYRDTSPGWVVSIGDDAVALLGEQVIRGPAARTVKTSVWLSYLSSIGRIRESIEMIAEEIGSGN